MRARLIAAGVAAAFVSVTASNWARALQREHTTAREARIPVGKASLYAREIGRGQPMIVLHGGPGFDHGPDLDRLADAFRLIYYDQRGRGKSADKVLAAEVTLASRDRRPRQSQTAFPNPRRLPGPNPQVRELSCPRGALTGTPLLSPERFAGALSQLPYGHPGQMPVREQREFTSPGSNSPEPLHRPSEAHSPDLLPLFALRRSVHTAAATAGSVPQLPADEE